MLHHIAEGCNKMWVEKSRKDVHLKGQSHEIFCTRFFFINQFILVPLEMSMGRFYFFLLFHRVITLLKQLPGTLETGESLLILP